VLELGKGNRAAREPQNRPGSSAEPGFPPEVKAVILRREGGCFLRGVLPPGKYFACWGPIDAHHRHLSGSGGSTAPGQHRPSNGVALCRGHHDGYVHQFRLKAEALGLIVSRFRNPALVPVRFREGGSELWLTDDGNYADHPPEPEDGSSAA
jgi:hypothetical protein